MPSVTRQNGVRMLRNVIDRSTDSYMRKTHNIGKLLDRSYSISATTPTSDPVTRSSEPVDAAQKLTISKPAKEINNTWSSAEVAKLDWGILTFRTTIAGSIQREKAILQKNTRFCLRKRRWRNPEDWSVRAFFSRHVNLNMGWIL